MPLQLLAAVPCTVNVNEPVAPGVPDTKPPGASVRPPGSVPVAIENAYGATPPLAVNSCEYGTPTAPPGNSPAMLITWQADPPESATVRVPPLTLSIVSTALLDPADAGWKLTVR